MSEALVGGRWKKSKTGFGAFELGLVWSPYILEKRTPDLPGLAFFFFSLPFYPGYFWLFSSFPFDSFLL